MLTYKRLSPVPMCWSNMTMLTYKRLQPSTHLLEYDHAYLQASTPSTHLLELYDHAMCWSWIWPPCLFTRVYTQLTYKRLYPVPMCWSYMTMLTYKRLHPSTHLLELYDHAYLHASTPSTHVLK